nr:MAG TPA_asm: hypothetical protein [Caudoviricetes sp.]
MERVLSGRCPARHGKMAVTGLFRARPVSSFFPPGQARREA